MNADNHNSPNQYKNEDLIKPRSDKIPPNQHEIDKIYELMSDTILFFDNYRINYHIVAGSALGQARNGGLIPYDDDVDFGIHRDDFEKVLKYKEFLQIKTIKLKNQK